MIEIDRLPTSEITEQHLKNLVTSKVTEGDRTLEFKQDIKIGTDSEKRELCTDVVSFANGAGGLMLHGIRAENGVAVEVLGLAISNMDGLILQTEQILHAGISPRLPWVKVFPISLANGRIVVAIKIPRSAIAPHAAGKEGVFRFFTRGTNGKLPMDIPQVRSSFLLSEGLRERLRSFRAERMGRIVANDGIASLTPGHKLILHLIPLGSLADPVEYNIAPFHSYTQQDLVVLGCQGSHGREFNLDGIADVYRKNDAVDAEGYVQLFQTRIVEAVDSDLVFMKTFGGEQYVNSISAVFAQSQLIVGITRYLSILRQLQVEAPVYILVSMMGMRKLAMWTSNHHKIPKLCDRDDLIFPEIPVFDLTAEPHVILRPVFDGLWRTFGCSNCPWYNADGSFEIPR